MSSHRGRAPRPTEWEERSSHSVVLILGLGNPLRRDDGIGPRVIEELQRDGLRDEIAALDGGTGGLDVLRMIEDWDHVIIVDAANVDAGCGKVRPGEFVRFTPDQVRLIESEDNLSLHHAGLAEVFGLARALNHALPSIVIFGVQPGDVGWGEGLSSSVEAGLPTLVEAVRNEAEQTVRDVLS